MEPAGSSHAVGAKCAGSGHPERDKRMDVEVIPHDAVIRVYDAAGNVIETREHAGDFKEP
jgi:hypothetical protein